MTVLFLFIGLLFLVIGFLILIANRQPRSEWTKSTGTVVGYTADANKMFSPVINFELGGKNYFVKCPVAAGGMTYSLGTKFNIYASNDPIPRIAFEMGTLKIFAWSFIFMGGISVAVFLVTVQMTWFYWLPGGLVLLQLGFSLHKARDTIAKLMDFKNDEFKQAIFPQAVLGNAPNDCFAMVELGQVAVVRESSRRQVKIAGIALVLAGLGGSYASWQWHIRRDNFLATAVQTSGVVIRLEESFSDDSTVYYPIIQYRNPASKKEITFRHSVGSNPATYSSGQQVNVLYSPDNPSAAMLDNGWVTQVTPYLALGIFASSGLRWIQTASDS